MSCSVNLLVWVSLVSDSEETLTAGTLIDGARMCAAAADAVNDKLLTAFFGVHE